MKTGDLFFKVGPGEEGRLDRYLSFRIPGTSRARIQSLIRKGCVKVSGRPRRPSHPLREGEGVLVMLPPEPPPAGPPADPEALRWVLWEDDHVLVINKPSGIVVHPGAGHSQGTLLQKMVPKFSPEPWPDASRLGMVHRLDKDTSGVLLLAKTPFALANLSDQFATRQVIKVYRAIVWGRPKARAGKIESHLARHPSHRTRFAVSGSGRWAETGFRVLEEFADSSYLEVVPTTGRSHQIRVHLSHLGHPILGDRTYARATLQKATGGFPAPRTMLHALSLTFRQPATGEEKTVKAPLPPDFEAMLERLKELP